MKDKTMKRSLLSAAIACCLFPAAPGFAYQPLVTDDTVTQGKDGNQFELGFSRDRAQQGGITSTARVLPFTYTRGLSDELDVFVSVNHTRLGSSVPGGDASGSGNPSVGFKWRFLENESSKTSLAVKPELRLPIDSSKEAAGLGNGRASYGVTAILTQETGFGAIHANLGTSRARFRDARTNPDATLWHVSVAPVWHLGETWKLALDLGSDSESAGGSNTRSSNIEFGAVYSPNKDLDFAFGIIRRTDNATPGTTTRALTAGITWRFR